MPPQNPHDPESLAKTPGTRDATPTRLTRLVQNALEKLHQARVAGTAPNGVWLLEPMPGNHARLVTALNMGFFAVEVPLGSALELRGVLGLPVWLYGSTKGSEWIVDMAMQVMACRPLSLYVQYRGAPRGELPQTVLRHPAALVGYHEEAMREEIRAAGPRTALEGEALHTELMLRGEEFVEAFDPFQWLRLDLNIKPSPERLLRILAELAPVQEPVEETVDKPWWEE